jgi:hypothetical protein
MLIDVGGSSNYVEQTRYVELAVVSPADSKTDDVTVVPQKFLSRGGTIQDDMLPFDLEIKQYMVNSRLVDPARAGPSVVNPADAGDGLARLAEGRSEGSGVDQDQKVDTPSLYATLKQKSDGKVMGTYLFSVLLGPQAIKVDDKTYDVNLRFQRSYKPYTLHLIKFTHKLYPGTEVPKDFASDVRLVDPERGEDREIRIWMNHPLYYRGETFYQQSFLPGDTATILQVVRNPGWVLPYVSCCMVALGMLVHFGLHLTKFLSGRVRA